MASLEARVLSIENGASTHHGMTEPADENFVQGNERDATFQVEPTPDNDNVLDNVIDTPTSHAEVPEPIPAQLRARPDCVNLAHLYDTWFAKYHAWCPILHQPTCYTKVMACQGLCLSQQDLVTKAVAAFTWHDCQLELLASDSTFSVSSLARETVYEAMAVCSIDSLAALLILAVREYGEHEAFMFRSVLGVCRE